MYIIITIFMGCVVSVEEDRFVDLINEIKSFQDLQQKLVATGLNSCELIVAFDFNKKMLEKEIDYSKEVTKIVGLVLNKFVTDNSILALGYEGQATFPLIKSDLGETVTCDGVDGVINSFDVVNEKYKHSKTNFSLIPIIDRAVEVVKREDSQHTLLVVCTSQPTDMEDFTRCLINASNYKLNIIVVGVAVTLDTKWNLLDKVESNNFRFLQFKPDDKKDYKNYVLEFAIRAFLNPGAVSATKNKCKECITNTLDRISKNLKF